MTVRELMVDGGFEVINAGAVPERPVTKPFCCDLLSFAMSRAPEGCVWVTVMNNMNTLAVAALTDAACVIMAEGALLDDEAKKKAKLEGITVLRTSQPIFETALGIDQMIKAKNNEETLL